MIEAVLGMIVSTLSKRSFGEPWKKEQSFGFALEFWVDYIFVLFLIFMATTFATSDLEVGALGVSLALKKEAWALVLIICVVVAALCWKQSKNKIFATVNLKNSPDWLGCLYWSVPNLVLSASLTYFVLFVQAV